MCAIFCRATPRRVLLRRRRVRATRRMTRLNTAEVRCRSLVTCRFFTFNTPWYIRPFVSRENCGICPCRQQVLCEIQEAVGWAEKNANNRFFTYLNKSVFCTVFVLSSPRRPDQQQRLVAAEFAVVVRLRLAAYRGLGLPERLFGVSRFAKLLTDVAGAFAMSLSVCLSCGSHLFSSPSNRYDIGVFRYLLPPLRSALSRCFCVWPSSFPRPAQICHRRSSRRRWFVCRFAS